MFLDTDCNTPLKLEITTIETEEIDVGGCAGTSIEYVIGRGIERDIYCVILW